MSSLFSASRTYCSVSFFSTPIGLSPLAALQDAVLPTRYNGNGLRRLRALFSTSSGNKSARAGDLTVDSDKTVDLRQTGFDPQEGTVAPSASNQTSTGVSREGGQAFTREYGFVYQGPEPTRYGDWSHNGRVTDF